MLALAESKTTPGLMLHIDQVASGLGCDCKCPACGAALVARKGPEKEHHFGHHTSKNCTTALETSLHKFAKQVLLKHLKVLVPAVEANLLGRWKSKSEAKFFSLDTVVLEQRFDKIVPDVIAQKGDRKLLIEIFVTHRCSPAKIEFVRREGLSMMEINLSRVPRLAPMEEIEAAILQAAPRHWVYNPFITGLEEQIRQQLEAETQRAREHEEIKRRAEQEAFERQISSLTALVDKARIGREIVRFDNREEVFKAIQDAGYAKAIGIRLAGDYVFRTERGYWQAMIVEHFILEPFRRHRWQTHFTTADAVNLVMPPLVRPSFKTLAKRISAALSEGISDFRQPEEVVDAYLGALEAAKFIRLSSWGAWVPEQAPFQAHEAAQREKATREQHRTEIFESLSKIIAQIPPHLAKRVKAGKWFKTELGVFRSTPSGLLDTGDGSKLIRHLERLSRMLKPGGQIETDLLGLPLEDFVRARQEEARLEKVRLQEEAAEVARKSAEQTRLRTEWRVQHVEQEALIRLGRIEGNAWLAAPAVTGWLPLQLAEASEELFERALGLLNQREEEIRVQKHLEWNRKELIHQMTQRAELILGSHELANLWIKNQHPKLGRASPENYCRTREDTDFCLALLKPTRRR